MLSFFTIFQTPNNKHTTIFQNKADQTLSSSRFRDWDIQEAPVISKRPTQHDNNILLEKMQLIGSATHQSLLESPRLFSVGEDLFSIEPRPFYIAVYLEDGVVRIHKEANTLGRKWPSAVSYPTSYKSNDWPVTRVLFKNADKQETSSSNLSLSSFREQLRLWLGSQCHMDRYIPLYMNVIIAALCSGTTKTSAICILPIIERRAAEPQFRNAECGMRND